MYFKKQTNSQDGCVNREEREKGGTQLKINRMGSGYEERNKSTQAGGARTCNKIDQGHSRM